jgi:hypothetical protein
MRIDGFTLHDPRAVGYGAGAAIACACALVRYALDRRSDADSAAPEPADAALAADAAAATEAATEAATGDEGMARPAVAAVAAGAASPPEVKSTAAYTRPTVTVTIGADGAPAFMTADPGAATGSYHVLTSGGIAERDGGRAPSIGL